MRAVNRDYPGLVGGRAVGSIAIVLLAAGCASPLHSSWTPVQAPSASPASRIASPTPPDGEPAESARPSAEGRPLKGLTIVVDPGHNGANASHLARISRLVDAGGFRKPCNTTGTDNPYGTESAFNWELALLVRRDLQALGAHVVLTRQNDSGWGPCVDERGRVARSAHAAALVSLHADGAAPSGHGFHVIHPGPLPGYTVDTAGPSRRLAIAVRDALKTAGLTPSTYVGAAGLDERTDLGTLNWASVPAVLLEAGNMANPDDARLLASASGRERIAAAVAAGLASELPIH